MQDVPGVCWKLLYWHEVHTQNLLLSQWTAISRQVTVLLFHTGYPEPKERSFPWSRRIGLENTQASLASKSPRGPDEMHPQVLRDTWQTPQIGCSQLSLKGHDDQERCLRTGRKQMSSSPSIRSGRRTQGTTDPSSSPQSLEVWWSASC